MLICCFALLNYLKNIHWKESIKSLFYALFIAIVFRSFLYEPYAIPSSSMYPNLRIGDYLFLSKYSYGYSRYSLPFGLNIIPDRVLFHKPQPGEIIVFKLPSDTSTNYIKRLIGVPGDRVQLIEGELYLNGDKVPTSFQGQEVYDDTLFDVYEETLQNNAKYKILRLPNVDHSQFPYTTPEYVVPEDHYFFLGDNRDNSGDSRYLEKVGYVPKINLVGRTSYLVYSTDFSIIHFLKTGETGRAFSKFEF